MRTTYSSGNSNWFELVGVLYILDEPSIGLHQRDNQKLIQSLKALRDVGNSVVVVEHDKDMIEQADHIIDIGPKAGKFGGEIIQPRCSITFTKCEYYYWYNIYETKKLLKSLKSDVKEMVTFRA